MRDILFRGKRVDNGEWVCGYYVVAETHNKSGLEYFIIEETAEGQSYHIAPKTVGQYTGLTDKNGTKIFEGDVVSTDLQRPYNIVVFRQGCFMYNCNDGNEDYYDIMLPILDEEQTCDSYVEVIGNIYDDHKPPKESD